MRSNGYAATALYILALVCGSCVCVVYLGARLCTVVFVSLLIFKRIHDPRAAPRTSRRLAHTSRRLAHVAPSPLAHVAPTGRRRQPGRRRSQGSSLLAFIARHYASTRPTATRSRFIYRAQALPRESRGPHRTHREAHRDTQTPNPVPPRSIGHREGGPGAPLLGRRLRLSRAAR